MKEFEIKKCPFCGQSASLKVNYSEKKSRWYFFIQCNLCFAKSQSQTSYVDPEQFDDLRGIKSPIERVVEAWNRRQTDEHSD